MPTFFRPGGRTFAGGDRMPWVIPWHHAGELKTHATNTAAAIRPEILDAIALRTATFLSITLATSALPEPIRRLYPNAPRLDSPRSRQTAEPSRLSVRSVIHVVRRVA